jgi:hypothetical protein
VAGTPVRCTTAAVLYSGASEALVRAGISGSLRLA